MNVPSYEQLLAENERLREEGRKDYEGMREFQQKFIAADQELRKLRAELDALKVQKPVAWLHETRRDSDVVTDAVKHVWGKAVVGALADYSIPLYLAPGAQPAPESCPCCGEAMRVYSRCLNAGCEAVMTTPEQSRYNKVLALMKTCATRLDEPPAPSIPEGWKPIPEKHPTFDLVDLRLADGSVLCGCVPQSDGDYWWNGPSGEVFIDPKYAPVTHWRLSAAPKPEVK